MNKKQPNKKDFGKANSTRNQKVSGCGGFVHMENGRVFKRTVLRSATTPPAVPTEADTLLEELESQQENSVQEKDETSLLLALVSPSTKPNQVHHI